MLSRGQISNLIVAIFACSLLLSCEPNGNYQGVEYAPDMYHSVAYDPYSQITDSIAYGRGYYNSNPYNQYKGKKQINMMLPVEGTVPRQNYRLMLDTAKDAKDKTLYFYELHKDSLALAGRALVNPVPLDSTGMVVGEGKKLYVSYCQPCHGEKGLGDGKVGGMYKGVANLTGAAYKNLSEGHIFHAISHGKGRMWGFKMTLSAEDRWKVVHYVKKLQKGEG
ncbi:MAG: cytochrome c [Thermoflexibacter sp.]|jgi:cytochrome c|nr:cytochrome c [Thermoflexibacter sp.]